MKVNNKIDISENYINPALKSLTPSCEHDIDPNYNELNDSDKFNSILNSNDEQRNLCLPSIRKEHPDSKIDILGASNI